MMKVISRTLGLSLFVFLFMSVARSQESTKHGIIPLKAPRAGQWFERVWGDPDVPGQPFVARIHADAGYIVLPHTHPIDENIVVLEGVWAFAMGSRYHPSHLTSIVVGGFAFGPKNMPHYAWSKTESTIQVHGQGPFVATLVDPAYDLTEKGTFLLTHLLRPGSPTSSVPQDCFPWKIGTRVEWNAGKGTVIGARCSPVNKLTQYWVRDESGGQSWVLGQNLKVDKGGGTN